MVPFCPTANALVPELADAQRYAFVLLVMGLHALPS
jgi:hypothetical protein